ncbi:hypothetical protein [Phytoactinopolyspora halotolerans]|uniref:Uncharacterized protein n=1 Tax=Phytoactinopolyspora halotolerans TaxID=1981512 RepID=A0A6L9SAI2_9ACTN|nr:hypothetical protein [Phytoactinopolyspora halotolerans]NEE02266.1 hypothetical protein [Phytoactinopolyspora halotolerans]
MSAPLTRRAVLAGASAAGLALAAPGLALAQEQAYAAFRIVRARPDEPDRPEISVPEGYGIVPGDRYSVASRAEYYTFVQGPRSAAGIEVDVRWPGVTVEAVIHQENRLEIRRDPAERDRFRFTLPMTQPTIDANQPTIQVWSYPDISPGMYWRIEHNDPDRVAGPWTTVAWPAGQVRSVIHQLVATHAILRDAGLVTTAAGKGHRFVLMGFETNNTLHPDNPPHWHISYNSGPDFGSPTHNPHFWFDAEGRNYYNGMDVTGLGRLRHYVGEPAGIYDFIGDANGGRGNLVVTITIREDGGLDIEPPDGPGYAIAAGRDGTLLEEVTVLRGGDPWLRVRTTDRVRLGVLTIGVDGLHDPAEARAEVQRYDRLTGVLR